MKEMKLAELTWHGYRIRDETVNLSFFSPIPCPSRNDTEDQLPECELPPSEYDRCVVFYTIQIPE